MDELDGFDVGTLDPTDAGGTPSVMPSNNVFDDLGQSLVGDIKVLAGDLTTRAATSGVIAGATANPPPGGGGQHPAAATVPGGIATIPNELASALGMNSAGGGGLFTLALVGFLVWKFLR